MNTTAMICYLESMGCIVSTLGNDTFHIEHSRGLPDCLWNLPGWVVSSSCGYGRAFLMKV
jgi:hypothetical protein